jgi:hypothetical protein
LYTLLRLLSPRTVALITNTVHRSRGYVVGKWHSDLGWHGLKTVIRAGSAAMSLLGYDPERNLPVQGFVWRDVDLVQIYTDTKGRKDEILSTIGWDVNSSLNSRPRPNKDLQIWVQAEEQVTAARGTALSFDIPEAEVAKVKIEVHPEGLEGWWEDQKAKKQHT